MSIKQQTIETINQTTKIFKKNAPTEKKQKCTNFNFRSCVQITDVQVLDNPTSFLNPFQFEITFECIRDLQEGINDFYIVEKN